MILAKQLELRNANSAPQATPRENLAKELEKYNRPELASASYSAPRTIEVKNMELSEMLKSEPLTKVSSSDLSRHAPRRPNILSKRPHMQTKKMSMMSGSTGNKILDAYNTMRSGSPSSLSSTSSLFASSPKAEPSNG